MIHVRKKVDVDVDNNYKPFLSTKLKTDAAYRDIPMIPKLSEFLKNYVADVCESDDSLLFTTRTGGLCCSSNFDSRWKTILRKVNKFMPEGMTTDISPHYIRHNFATNLFYSGVDLKMAQYIMGHESLTMTLQVYTDLKPDKELFVKQLDTYLNQDGVSKRVSNPNCKNIETLKTA